MIEKIEYRIFEYPRNALFSTNSFLIDKYEIYDYYLRNYKFMVPNYLSNDVEIVYNIFWSLNYYTETGIEGIYQYGTDKKIKTNSVFLKQNLENELLIIENKKHQMINNRIPDEVKKGVNFSIFYNKIID